MSNGPLDDEKKKKAIFKSMSDRNRKKILAKGYENWDPFVMPKDPIDIREFKKKETAASITKNFLITKSHDDYSAEYGKGVFEICMGILGNNEKYLGMYEFSCWYSAFLKERES